VIISAESVFRKIPSALSRRQALFVEGIRYSVDMIDVAYSRLRDTLVALAGMNQSNSENMAHVSAMLDAWSIVDSLNRLRRLVEYFPGSQGKNKSAAYRVFMSVTEKIPDLRNTVQHLETAIKDVTNDLNWAVWGSLSWGVVDAEKNQVSTCLFLPGMPLGSRPMINPLDRKLWHMPIDSITIERSGVSVSLSDAMRRVIILVRSLEESLAEAYKQIPEEHRDKTHAADVTVTLVIGVSADRIVSEGTPDPEPALSSALEDEPEAQALADVAAGK
jgi:hypothetical protein